MAAEISDAPSRPDLQLATSPSGDVSESAHLRARGASFVLNGESRRAILDYEAIEFIEDRFDGLDRFVERLFENGWKARRVHSIRLAITAALLHEKPEEQSIDEFVDEIRSLINLDTRQRALFDAFSEYREALHTALFEAFPSFEGKAEHPKGKGRTGSRGNGSTTSQRSGSAGRTASSGA